MTEMMNQKSISFFKCHRKPPYHCCPINTITFVVQEALLGLSQNWPLKRTSITITIIILKVKLDVRVCVTLHNQRFQPLDRILHLLFCLSPSSGFECVIGKVSIRIIDRVPIYLFPSPPASGVDKIEEGSPEGVEGKDDWVADNDEEGLGTSYCDFRESE